MVEKMILAVGDQVRDTFGRYCTEYDGKQVMDIVFVDDENRVAECQYYDRYLQKHSHIMFIGRLKKILS